MPVRGLRAPELEDGPLTPVEGGNGAHPWDVAGYALMQGRRVWLELYESRLLICAAPDAKTDEILALEGATVRLGADGTCVDLVGGFNVDYCSGHDAAAAPHPKGVLHSLGRSSGRKCEQLGSLGAAHRQGHARRVAFGTAAAAETWVRHLQLVVSRVVSFITRAGADRAVAASRRCGSFGGALGKKQPPRPAQVALTPLGRRVLQRSAATADEVEVLEMVGCGHFASVARGRDRATGVELAVKKARGARPAAAGSEREALAALSHPFVVGLLGSFREDGVECLLLPFLAGGELFLHIQHEGRFAEPRARFYAAGLACALEYLHGRGVVYRDLKPENCVLDADGYAVLTDFGLAASSPSPSAALPSPDEQAALCGTPGYLAPELLEGRACSPAVDWWALGCVLYFMLAGAPLFGGGGAGDAAEQGQVYAAIAAASLPPFPTFSAVASGVLRDALLVKNPTLRRARCAADALRSHAFFSDVDWALLEARALPAPPFAQLLPRPADASDLFSDFSGRFSSPVQLQWGGNGSFGHSLCR